MSQGRTLIVQENFPTNLWALQRWLPSTKSIPSRTIELKSLKTHSQRYDYAMSYLHASLGVLAMYTYTIYTMINYCPKPWNVPLWDTQTPRRVTSAIVLKPRKVFVTKDVTIDEGKFLYPLNNDYRQEIEKNREAVTVLLPNSQLLSKPRYLLNSKTKMALKKG